jgi:hypothetical protein
MSKSPWGMLQLLEQVDWQVELPLQVLQGTHHL